MRFAKLVFLIAGIYGLLLLAPVYFLESQIVPADAVVIRYLVNRVAPLPAVLGSVDLLFAVLFAAAYAFTPAK
jgi:hypothetical protein